MCWQGVKFCSPFPYFIYTKTQSCFFRFSYRATLYFYLMNALVDMSGFCIYKIWQILKRFAGTFLRAQTLKLGRVFYQPSFQWRCQNWTELRRVYRETFYKTKKLKNQLFGLASSWTFIKLFWSPPPPSAAWGIFFTSKRGGNYWILCSTISDGISSLQ